MLALPVEPVNASYGIKIKSEYRYGHIYTEVDVLEQATGILHCMVAYTKRPDTGLCNYSCIAET